VSHFDLLIIGAGSGNSILTPEFDDWKVAIVERAAFGGTCLNHGCIPSKMLVLAADRMVEADDAVRLGLHVGPARADWPAIRDRVFGRIDPIAASGLEYRRFQGHVEVVTGEARFTGPRRVEVREPDRSSRYLEADRIVIAAGASPRIPLIPGLDRVAFHTSDTIMRVPRLPEHLVILGGGFVSAELGHVFAALGSKVSVIQRGDRLLRHEDEEVSARFTEVFGRRVDLHLGAWPTAVHAAGGSVTVEFDQVAAQFRDEVPRVAEVTGDVLLVATGRMPNGAALDAGAAGVQLDAEGYVMTDDTLATTAEGVWAIGDVRNPLQLKHLANQEARAVSHNLLHPDQPVRVDQGVVPRAVFSHPQVASVGFTEAALVAAGQPYVVGRADYAAVAYGWGLEDSTGFAKVLVDPRTDLLLGAHFIGSQAATLVQQASQAMAFGLTAESLARNQIWCHPALPEVFENALLDAAASRPGPFSADPTLG
jgi:mycothione reductase